MFLRRQNFFLSRIEKELVFIGVLKCCESNCLFFNKSIPCGHDIHEDVRGCFPMGELVARTFHILNGLLASLTE